MVLVEITDAGRSVTDVFRPLVHRNERDWLSALTEVDKAQLLDLLSVVQTGLAE
jgi:hypothetical protein